MARDNTMVHLRTRIHPSQEYTINNHPTGGHSSEAIRWDIPQGTIPLEIVPQEAIRLGTVHCDLSQGGDSKEGYSKGGCPISVYFVAGNLIGRYTQVRTKGVDKRMDQKGDRSPDERSFRNFLNFEGSHSNLMLSNLMLVLTMVYLIGLEARLTTELAATVVLLLSSKDTIAVIITIGEDNTIAISISTHWFPS